MKGSIIVFVYMKVLIQFYTDFFLINCFSTVYLVFATVMRVTMDGEDVDLHLNHYLIRKALI